MKIKNVSAVFTNENSENKSIGFTVMYEDGCFENVVENFTESTRVHVIQMIHEKHEKLVKLSEPISSREEDIRHAKHRRLR